MCFNLSLSGFFVCFFARLSPNYDQLHIKIKLNRHCFIVTVPEPYSEQNGGLLCSNVCLLRVPQPHIRAGQAHQSQITEMQRENREVGWVGGGGAQLRHKDNNVNTRITNRNTISSAERTNDAISSLPAAAPRNANVG